MRHRQQLLPLLFQLLQLLPQQLQHQLNQSQLLHQLLQLPNQLRQTKLSSSSTFLQSRDQLIQTSTTLKTKGILPSKLYTSLSCSLLQPLAFYMLISEWIKKNKKKLIEKREQRAHSLVKLITKLSLISYLDKLIKKTIKSIHTQEPEFKKLSKY